MDHVSAIDHAYQMFCTERFPVVSESDIASLENRIRAQFSIDYRQFLLNYNGGYFNEPHIISPNALPLDRLTFMHGIRATHPDAELGQEADLAIFDDNDPAEIVPIGYTIMGNLILLITCPEPDENGSIILKSTEDSIFLATGIEEFFGLLQTPLYE